MKLNIGTNIRQLRNINHYTQDDLAKLCDISSAAISKWENNLSYPDITMLPILARIFNITIDELLSFEMLLDEATIHSFVKEFIDRCDKSFEDGMTFCKSLLHTYPNSELLKLKIAGSHMNLAMCVYGQPNAETFIHTFSSYAKELCKQLIGSHDLTIRQSACILYSNFVESEDEIRECIHFIQNLPKHISTTSIESSLYLMLKESDKAKHMVQTQLYSDCSNIILYLLLLIQIAQQDEQVEDARTLLKLCERFNDTMELHSVVIPQLCFPYAKLKDEKNTLRLLKKYMEQAEYADDIYSYVQSSLTKVPWFSTVELSENTGRKGNLQKAIIDTIQWDPQFSFLHDCEEYKQILSEISK